MKHAGDIINAIFDAEHSRRADTCSSLFNGWRAIAGEDLASHSRIIDVRNGTLLIEVDHPGWLQMVRLREKAILRDVKRKFAALEIRRLGLRTSSDKARSGEASASEVATRAPTALNVEEVETLRNVESEGYHEFRALLDRVRKLGEP